MWLRLAGGGTEVIDLDGRPYVSGRVSPPTATSTWRATAGRSVASAECRDFYDPTIRIPCRGVADRSCGAGGGTRRQASGSSGAAARCRTFALREGRLPTKEELDTAAPNNPCLDLVRRARHRDELAGHQGARHHARHAEPDGRHGGDGRGPASRRACSASARSTYQARAEPGQGPGGAHRHRAGPVLAARRHPIHDIVINRDEMRAYQMLAR